MNFKEHCESGSFLDDEFNGTIDGFLIGPEHYSNQLNFFQRIFFGILFSCLTTTSIIGNTLALCIISKRKLQVLHKSFVVSQCVGDALTAVFVGLNSLNNFIEDTIAWNFGDFMCSWIPYVTTASAVLSSMILTSIAIDRYQGVVLLSGKWDPKLGVAVLVVASVWLTAAGATVPTFLGYDQIGACFIDFEANTSSYNHLCVANRTISNYYFFAIFVMIFLPLLVAFVVLNGAIARTMWLRRREERAAEERKSSSGEQEKSAPFTSEFKSAKMSRRSKKKLRTFFIILAITGAFIVCRLPQWIFIVVTTLPWVRLSGNFWWVVKYSLSALSLANTSVNPFIYSILNEVVNIRSSLTSGLNDFKKFGFRNIRVNSSYLKKKKESRRESIR